MAKAKVKADWTGVKGQKAAVKKKKVAAKVKVAAAQDKNGGKASKVSSSKAKTAGKKEKKVKRSQSSNSMSSSILSEDDSSRVPPVPRPQMAVQVHRIRCLPLPPSPILHLSPVADGLLVSRADGSITTMSKRLLPLVTLSGSSNARCHSSATTSRGIFITLTSGHLARVDVRGATYADLTPITRPAKGLVNIVVAGKEEIAVAEGVNVRVYDTEDGLNINTTIAVGEQVAALHWGSRIFVGDVTGCVRAYSRVGEGTGPNAKFRMDCRTTLAGSAGNGMKGGISERMATKGASSVIPAGIVETENALVVVDSRGQISVLDLPSLVERQVLKASAPCTAVVSSGSALHVSTTEARVMTLRCTDEGDFAVVENGRHHSHAVRTLAVADGKVYSGGDDARIGFMEPGSNERPRCIKCSPTGRVVGAGGTIGVVGGGGTPGVSLYKLGTVQDEKLSKRGLIETRPGLNVRCAGLAPNAEMLATSHAQGTAIAKIEYKENGEIDNVDDLEVPDEVGMCSALAWVDSATLACATTDHELIILKVSSEGRVVVDRCYDAPEELGGENVPPPTHVATDGRYVAVSRPILARGSVLVYDLNTNSTMPHYTVPKTDALVTSIRFYCTLDQLKTARSARKDSFDVPKSSFTITMENNTFEIHEAAEAKLTEWSQRNRDTPMPTEIRERNDFPIAITFDPARQNQFMLVSTE